MKTNKSIPGWARLAEALPPSNMEVPLSPSDAERAGVRGSHNHPALRTGRAVQVTNNQPPITNYLLPITDYQLPTVQISTHLHPSHTHGR